jgi:3-hydroxybutyryl-CoA dehydratase
MSDVASLTHSADRRMEGLHGFYLDELSVGMTAAFAKTVTEADIVLFAGISGDHNPLHVNHDYASGSMFEGPIAHGILSASLISTVLGTKLPGPGSIYLSQSLKFVGPVRAGDTVEARVTVTAIKPERRRVKLRTVCTVGGELVVDGEAEILVPARPD